MFWAGINFVSGLNGSLVFILAYCSVYQYYTIKLYGPGPKGKISYLLLILLVLGNSAFWDS
jgi:hypothetical protein